MIGEQTLSAQGRAYFLPAMTAAFCVVVNLAFCTHLVRSPSLAFALFLLWAVIGRHGEQAHAMLFFFLLSLGAAASRLVPVRALLPAPVPLLAPLALSTLLVLPFAAARRTLGWFRRGHADGPALLLTLVTALVSVAALMAWAGWSGNWGVGARMVQGFRAYPRWFVLCGGVPLFALANGFVEEAVFRGVVQEALARVFNWPLAVLVLQASVFAALHYAAGFPNGKIGYLMVFVYGWMLGYLRLRTNGLLAPWLAHVAADLAIGYLLVSRL